MKYFKKLVGENIYLSPISNEDVELFTEWMNDFETTDYTGRSAIVFTLEKEKKWIDECDKEDIVFTIVRNSDNKAIGTISLIRINQLNRTATLGILIGDKESRNKGYGTESIKLLLDYGFNYLNLNNIQLDVFEFNKRAQACYKKCGFKECGRRRQAMFLNGKYYDILSLDILAEEFNESYIKNKNI